MLRCVPRSFFLGDPEAGFKDDRSRDIPIIASSFLHFLNGICKDGKGRR